LDLLALEVKRTPLLYLRTAVLFDSHLTLLSCEFVPGHRVQVFYTGYLDKNKLFDQRESGKPFEFQLGRAETIQGWDIGIAGMRVGGTRKLWVPPSMGYGRRGKPPKIPSNAKLAFTIRLVNVK
jgi:FKBP-type peptidyl-prolyl cis-trans isomerase